MLDTAVIEEYYASLTNEQIIALADKEGHLISSEALSILKKEFDKRNLDLVLLENVEETKKVIHETKIQEIKESDDAQFLKTVWNYIFEGKANNQLDNIILAGLVERGLDEENATQLILSTEEKAKEKIESYSTDMVVGIVITIAGSFLTFGTLSLAQGGGRYFIFWGAMVFGPIRYFNARSRKKYFTNIINNIENQKEYLAE